jgi:hypothetical protein
MATCTYDPLTDNGKVRLLIGDTNEASCNFTDEEIGVFLEMARHPTTGCYNVRRAAAMAYRAWATDLTSTTASSGGGKLKIRTATFSKEVSDEEMASRMNAQADAWEAADARIPAGAAAEVAQTDWEAARIVINDDLRE